MHSCVRIVSECLPILLIYSRRSSNTLSDKPGDWCFALIGTAAPLLTDSSVEMFPSSHVQYSILALFVIGLCTQISAKIILWRSFGIVAANHGVKVHGPYRFVRHPMYVGYEITHVGVLLAFPSFYNFLLYSGALAIQIARLMREERVLNQDPAYQNFAARVRFRLVPGVF